MTRQWDTNALTALLKERHSGDHEALVLQVPDATGYGKSRTADALAMGLWPSKGLDLQGYEIKASRSDWLKEIQDHSKADAFARYCDFWWVVAAPKIVKPEEMPGSWGLLEPARTGSKLMVRKGAERTEAQPVDRDFLAALFRVVVQQSPSVEMLRSFWQRGYWCHQQSTAKDAKKQHEFNMDLNKRVTKRLQDDLEKFEAASGIKIQAYQGKKIGEAVYALMNMKDLEFELRKAENTVESLTEALDAATELRKQLAELRNE